MACGLPSPHGLPGMWQVDPGNPRPHTCSMGDLSSLTRDCWIFSHWTTREFPAQFFLKGPVKSRYLTLSLRKSSVFL